MKDINFYEEDFKNIASWNPSLIEVRKTETGLLKRIFNSIDLTSLNSTDSINSISIFCKKVLEFPDKFHDMPNVAAVCVYPLFASVLAKFLNGTDVRKAVVSASFPSSQTFPEIKIEETKLALSNGADEIDIVIPVGEFLENNYEFVVEDIASIKDIMGNAKLKVILETGALGTGENIWKASILAMNAGADFIKTSTGKVNISATPEAAWIMTHAIKAHVRHTGAKIGFKPAGGISTVDEAILYWSIVENVLGEEWLNNNLFRIGASRLANNLLTEIEKLNGNSKAVSFF